MNVLDDGQNATASAAAPPVAVADAVLQAPLRAATSPPTFLDDAIKEPWRFDFFMMMRRLERTFRDRPRIGDSASLREELVLLGQDPFMDFPASNLSRVAQTKGGHIRVHAKFLGLLGPQGALPLSTTEEAYGWSTMRDESFPRFLDIFNHRFLQLFYRAWGDARPIVQHDRPDADRFLVYVGAMIGVGSPPYRNLDTVPDLAKLAFAGLMAPQAKSASRLRALIGGLFGVRVEIEQFVGTRLTIEKSDRSLLGANNSGVGRDIVVGAAVYSVQDKIRIRIYTSGLQEYMRFLPTGDRCEPLVDAVFFYIGDQLDWEVELALPSREVEPVKVGSFGQLGWTSWMTPEWVGLDRPYRWDARFHPADILRQKRKRRHDGVGRA
ncbi:MAG: type VI secretion system baseplate subunit TssG [Xanthobacteraceae bacterium]|jgi:type VI secretion system protein ImpH